MEPEEDGIAPEELAELGALDLPPEPVAELPQEADMLDGLLDEPAPEDAQPEIVDREIPSSQASDAPSSDNAASETTPSDTPDEAVSDRAEDLPPKPPEKLIAAFATRREGDAALDETVAPRLGGVGRLSPPQPDRKKILTGEAGITAPKLDLPEPDPRFAPPEPKVAEKAAKAMGRAARKGLGGTAALGQKTANALAKSRPAKPAQAQSAAEAQPEKTVFGGEKRAPVGGKPRYLGAMLTGALVILLAIIALWSSLLKDPVGPEEIAQIPAAPSAPPEVSQPVDTATAPEATSPAETTPEPEPATPEPAPQPEAEAPAPEPDTPPAEMPALPQVTLAPPQPATAPEAAAEPAPQAEPAADPSGTLSTASPTTLPPFDATPLPPPVAEPAPEPEVTPTPEGTEMPGGFTLYAGKPDIVPAPRPDVVSDAYAATLPPTPEATFEALPALSGFTPKPRPDDLTGAAPDATPEPAPATPPADQTAPPTPTPPVDQGALDPALQPNPELQDTRPTARPEDVTRLAASQAPSAEPAAAANPELAAVRPERRPATIQDAVQGAVAAQDAAAAANSDPFAGATTLAVARSANPPEKPRNFSRSVERALAAAIAAEPAPSVAVAAAAAPAPAPKAQPVEIDEPEPVAPAPKLPTSASVAKQATEKNAINLRKINLIGLYGSSSNRRALVRLSNGRFVKVGVGDRLDGGKVTAIGSGQLTYKKGSRSYTLKLLEGS
ncbi:hypothetical protein TP2_08290 [Thioclava pacifica DSM 10166]|uniref:Type IV pilus biogenesis protein PilP n=2 Tax=Thioclava pacifica TaxID=285109 RepID=A0A074J8N8_9RHOB|nr:hypothetical protein TP2_08290 [Thioclava pacifica DSM 10166]